MFNPLTPAELVAAIGTTLRRATAGGEPTSDFERDQLKSAYSATRHLAVEIAAYPAELQGFAIAVAARVEAAVKRDPRLSPASVVAAALRSDPADPEAVGAGVGDLLALLRRAEGAVAAELLADVRARLRELADREVDLLAEGLS